MTHRRGFLGFVSGLVCYGVPALAALRPVKRGPRIETMVIHGSLSWCRCGRYDLKDCNSLNVLDPEHTTVLEHHAQLNCRMGDEWFVEGPHLIHAAGSQRSQVG